MQYQRWWRGRVAEPVYSIRNLAGKEGKKLERNVLFNDALSYYLHVLSVLDE